MRASGIVELGLTVLLRTVAAGSIRRKLARMALMAALAALAGLALLAAAAAAIAALWVWLSAELGSVHAALIMAAGFLALGLAMLLIVWLIALRSRRGGGADSLVHWLKSQSTKHQGELLLAAVLAGFVAGMESAKPSRSKPDGA